MANVSIFSTKVSQLRIEIQPIAVLIPSVHPSNGEGAAENALVGKAKDAIRKIDKEDNTFFISTISLANPTRDRKIRW